MYTNPAFNGPKDAEPAATSAETGLSLQEPTLQTPKGASRNLQCECDPRTRTLAEQGLTGGPATPMPGSPRLPGEPGIPGVPRSP